MGSLFLTPHQNWLDNSGRPLSGGRLYVYKAGTTTAVNTWQDAALSQINSNPVVLDAGGFCTVWLDPTKSYKFLMTNDRGVEMWSVDNYQGTSLTANILVPINYLLDATGPNDINNSNQGQTWRWVFTGSNQQAGLAITEPAASNNTWVAPDGSGRTNPIVDIYTAPGSTAMPLEVIANASGFGGAGFGVLSNGNLRLFGSARILLPDSSGQTSTLSQINAGAGAINIAGGAYSTATSWIAGSTEARILDVGQPSTGPNKGLELWANSGLTPGQPYSPTPVFGVDGRGIIQSASLATGITSCLQADPLGYISTTGTPCGGGGGGGGPIPLNNLQAATGIGVLNNQSFDQNWNWQLTGTNAVAGFSITENAPSTNTNPLSILGGFGTRTGSTIAVFGAKAHNGAAGIQVNANGDLTLVGTATLLFPDILGGTNQSQIHQGPGNLNIAGGAAIDPTNTTWTARNPIASVLQVGSGPGRGTPPTVNGGMELFANTNLTAGSPYSPTPVFGVDGNGVIQSNSLAGAGVGSLVADAGGNISRTGSPGMLSINGDTTPAQQIVGGPGVVITPLGNGVLRIDLVGVPPAAPQLASVTLNPTSVRGGAGVTGTVTLTGAAPTGGASVTLSSNSASAGVPATVTVAAGVALATFTITTSAVSASTTVTITGNYGVAQTATLTVTPANVSSVALSPTSVQGGTSSTGTVTLNGPAPTGGAVVTLSSNNASVASVPASVTVAAGATSATFTVTTTTVAANTTVTITANYQGSQTSNLTVTAPVAAQPIYGGVGTAGGAGPVTLSGTTVTLSNGTQLSQLQTTPEQVGQSWPFSPSGEAIYLLLRGGSHTFVDQNNTTFVMNAPITVSVSGTTMYLYQSTNVLIVPFTVKVNT